MKKLLITLLLISPFSFADWGDVYYCQMTTNSAVSPEGKRTDYTLEKFKFKLDKTKKAMAYGKEGHFANSAHELREGMVFVPSQERWYANGKYSAVHFGEGKFSYSYTDWGGIHSITANCDKF